MKVLRRELKFNGLTSGDLARILDITEAAIAKWMSGENKPKPIHVRKMIELGIDKEAAINPSEIV